MVLGSQSPREGMGPPMVTTGRKRRRMPRWARLSLLVAAVVVLAGGGYWLLGSGESPEPAEGREIADAGEEANDRQAGSDASGGQQNVGESGVYPDGDTTTGSDESESAEEAPAEPETETPSESPGSSEPSDGSGAADGDESDGNAVAELHLAGEADEPSATDEATAGQETEPSRGDGDDAPVEGDWQQAEGLAAAQQYLSAGNRDGRVSQGMQHLARGEFVEGRRILSQVLLQRREALTNAQADAIREALNAVNEKLIFSPKAYETDTLIETYRVQSGDMLASIAKRYEVPYPFIERINEMDARNLRVGQTIKLINGPFHARILKEALVMDVYLRDDEGKAIFVCSFPVGLGEKNSTPAGEWRIAAGRKVVNPDWRNPRTGEYYEADDPENPIGEYWLALKGTGPNTEDEQGYGIHGTIEPDSIGDRRSMGCVRLRSEDIKRFYHMMQGGASTVQIVE